jgi:hypothetical protein
MEMAIDTITPGDVHGHIRQWEHTAWTTELVLAVGAVVLSIVGLAGVFPRFLAALSIIALGAALLSRGANIVWRFSELLHEAGAGRKSLTEVSGALTTEFIGGLAGIVFGVLALIKIAPMTLMAVCIIAFGATLLLTTGEAAWLGSAVVKGGDVVRQISRLMTSAAAGAQVLVGLAALVLGILALAGVAPITVILAAALTVSAFVLLNSSAVGSWLLGILHV